MDLLSIYIHIPFCEQKCPYCDFYSYCSKENERKRYVDALVNEIETLSRCGEFVANPPEADTLYLGGGTPSVLSGEELFSAFGAHLMSLNDLVTLAANRVAAHGTASHLCGCLPGCLFFALHNEGSILIAVSGNRFTLPHSTAHHTFHAETHLAGRIPLNQIILHNHKSVPFRPDFPGAYPQL